MKKIAVVGDRFEHEGMVYEAAPTNGPKDCSGCAFHHSDCNMPQRPACSLNDVIFISLADLVADKLAGKAS